MIDGGHHHLGHCQGAGNTYNFVLCFDGIPVKSVIYIPVHDIDTRIIISVD